MGNDRYQMTLEEVLGTILSVRQEGVLMGISTKCIVSGYLLSNGTVLLESEKDENGFYVGGNYVNGEYLKSQERYEPVRNEDGAITGFRQMSAYLHQFSGEEQKLIFQYALNTKSNLLEDLEQILKIVKNQQLRQCRFVNEALHSYTEEKESRTCLGERQRRGRIGKLL